MWVDDPHFNLGYHVRHSALPAPGSDEQLAALGGRIFAVGLDRHKPLWEIHLVEGLAPGHDGTPRFALLAKTHHALVDGVSGVDITSVLFSTTPDPMPVGPPASPVEPAPGAELRAAARAGAARARVVAGRGRPRRPRAGTAPAHRHAAAHDRRWPPRGRWPGRG